MCPKLQFMKDRAQEILENLKGKTGLEFLRGIAEYSSRITFSTSFGKEDQVITDLLFSSGIKTEIFTLDTGRLFEATYEVWQRTLVKYKTLIKAYYPQEHLVHSLVSEKGPCSFYDSVENRKECCYVRKIEPLRRALKGFDIWITGLRREQSENRSEMKMVEWDDSNAILKVHPLFEWTEEEVDRYVESQKVPVNSLHKKGYPSIGCAPCTRAIELGEDFRAGRWWWESSKKECGLHTT